MRPIAAVSHGYTRSAGKDRARISNTMPSDSTDAVCISATEAPTATACPTLAPDPTRYAAVIVLPCPGPRAWAAPNRKASRRDTTSTRGVSLRPIRAANAPPLATGTFCTVGSPGARSATADARPGPNAKLAPVTSSGLDRRSNGQASSSRLMLAAGTLDAVTATPTSDLTVISFQPILPWKLRSRYRTDPEAGASPVKVASRRRVGRPAWPGR